VLISAPANALGGQAHAARRIVEGFRGHPAVEVELQPIDPQLSGPARHLTRWSVVRSVVKPILYVWALVKRVPTVDVVHVFCAAHTAFLVGAVPAVAVARWYRRPVVLNYHDGRAEAHWRWWRPVLRWALRSASILAVPSGYLQSVFRRRGFEGTIVTNVVDTGAFSYRHPEPVPFRLISARLLEPLYAVENTIRAFVDLQREIPGGELHIYGSGQSARALRRLAQDLGVEGIHFHGAVPHATMPQVFSGGGILVNSSRIDNMPHVMIEAFAAGLPIVSTDAGGIPYIVEHERTGLLVPVDRPDAMARAILRLLREPGLAARLTEAGRAECDRYGWPEAEAGWLRVYREAAGRSRERASDERSASSERTRMVEHA